MVNQVNPQESSPLIDLNLLEEKIDELGIEEEKKKKIRYLIARYSSMLNICLDNFYDTRPYVYFYEYLRKGDRLHFALNTTKKRISTVDGKKYNRQEILDDLRGRLEEIIGLENEKKLSPFTSQIMRQCQITLLSTLKGECENKQSPHQFGHKHLRFEGIDMNDIQGKTNHYIMVFLHKHIGQKTHRDNDNDGKLLLNNEGCHYLHTLFRELITYYEHQGYNSDLIILLSHRKNTLNQDFDGSRHTSPYFVKLIVFLLFGHQVNDLPSETKKSQRSLRGEFLHKLMALDETYRSLDYDLIQERGTSLIEGLSASDLPITARIKKLPVAANKQLRKVENPDWDNDMIGIRHESQTGEESILDNLHSLLTNLKSIVQQHAKYICTITDIRIANKDVIEKNTQTPGQPYQPSKKEITVQKKIQLLFPGAIVYYKRSSDDSTQTNNTEQGVITRINHSGYDTNQKYALKSSLSPKPGTNGTYKDLKVQISYTLTNKETYEVHDKVGKIELQARPPHVAVESGYSAHRIYEAEREIVSPIRENATKSLSFIYNRLWYYLMNYVHALVENRQNYTAEQIQQLYTFTLVSSATGESVDLTKFDQNMDLQNPNIRDLFTKIFLDVLHHRLERGKLIYFVYDEDIKNINQQHNFSLDLKQPSISYPSLNNITVMVNKYGQATVNSKLRCTSSNFVLGHQAGMFPDKGYIILPGGYAFGISDLYDQLYFSKKDVGNKEMNL